MDLIIEPEDDDDDLPVGDAVLPLLLMAAMLGVWRTWRRRREIMA
jgi:MYXO-CTERM domain-containing protein